jgi:hypothetical protein
MQRAILAFSGSDGLVSIRPMLDCLWREFPRVSREDFVEEVGKALLKLHRLGDLYLERQFGVERRIVKVDEWEDFSLQHFVVWDSSTQQWAVSERQGGADDILVQLSQGGVDDLRLYELQNEERGHK